MESRRPRCKKRLQFALFHRFERYSAAMADRDYYEILGVPRDASPDAIKKAYRSLARKYHPDVNPGDKKAEKQFKEAQSAYDVLSDAEKRSLYDRFGHAGVSGMAAAGPHAGAADWTRAKSGGNFEGFDFGEYLGGGSTDAGGGIFEELIGRMRGGARRPGSQVRGPVGTLRRRSPSRF